MPVLYVPEKGLTVSVAPGTNLMLALRQNGVYPDAPCGGNGTCGKCKVLANGVEVLACHTAIHRDITVALPQAVPMQILQDGCPEQYAVDPLKNGYLLALDIGTTTVVCFLLDGVTGAALGKRSIQNPQAAFGADVISRLQAASKGQAQQLTDLIRSAVAKLVQDVCGDGGISPEEICVLSVVGNPAMQQLFLGVPTDNLTKIPFTPALTAAQVIPCRDILSILPNAQLLVVPNISGFVGSDTLACLLATRLYENEETTLLVDIGTNGEMVMGSKGRLVACATAAGPALEGANIRFGMRAAPGAIDHIWLDSGEIKYSVIGDVPAQGICGSGIIDAIAVGLQLGVINKRGKLLTEDRILHLSETIFLTQEDIRQVQLAKGAIFAGITLMAEQLNIQVQDIQRVLLAGAFGSFLNPESACRIGLLPESLLHKIEVVGNAAGSGAQLLALDKTWLPFTQALIEKVDFLELASLDSFPKVFAKAMLFREEDPATRWLCKAKALGFDAAVTLDPKKLIAREDVRAMCAQDSCGAYGKNWTCPPAIGTVSQCQQKMWQYKTGILLQTIGHMEKVVDSKCYRETEQRHMDHFYALADAIRKECPDALCLGAGGCRICSQCAYPQACRFPEKAVSSMEGYGLFVTQVCRDAGIPYHYGEKTITYTACILI